MRADYTASDTSWPTPKARIETPATILIERMGDGAERQAFEERHRRY